MGETPDEHRPWSHAEDAFNSQIRDSGNNAESFSKV